MKRVIIESPYAGNIYRNLQYAKECMLNSLGRGEAPLASHLLYTQILDDDIPYERDMGIRAGLEWATVADKHVFYTDYGYSTGMLLALQYAKDNNLEIEERKIYEK